MSPNGNGIMSGNSERLSICQQSTKSESWEMCKNLITPRFFEKNKSNRNSVR